MPSPVGEGHCDDSIVTHSADSSVFVALPFWHAHQKTGVSAVRTKDGAVIVSFCFCIPTVVLLVFDIPFHLFTFTFLLLSLNRANVTSHCYSWQGLFHTFSKFFLLLFLSNKIARLSYITFQKKNPLRRVGLLYCCFVLVVLSSAILNL